MKRMLRGGRLLHQVNWYNWDLDLGKYKQPVEAMSLNHSTIQLSFP